MVQAGRAALLLACFSSLLVDCSALIPVIGWSNSDAFGSVKGNQFSSANEFIYDASLDNVDMVVIFKSPELSFDSLAKYGGVFGGKNPTMSSLQAEIKGSKSSAWVGVDGSVASDLIRTLSFIMGVDPHIITGADGLTSKHKLVQVELSPTSDNFSDQDDVISEVMSALHSLPESSRYAAIYTSSHTHIPRSSRHQEEDLVRRRRDAEEFRIPRAVNEDADTKEPLCASIFRNSTAGEDDDQLPCLLFCFTDTNVTVVNGTGGNAIFNVTDLAFVGGDCDKGCNSENSSACLMVTGIKGTNSTDGEESETEPITFQFTFPYGACVDKLDRITCGFWTMELYVDDTRYRRATEESKIFSTFLVPDGTSYACGDNDLNTYLPANSNNTDGFRFKGLQVQLFSGITVQSTDPPVYGFGSAYHCQGYVNTISLMGLTAIIILVLILYSSVVFMFSIKTQDRFDDPRAPTISVENLH